MPLIQSDEDLRNHGQTANAGSKPLKPEKNGVCFLKCCQGGWVTEPSRKFGVGEWAVVGQQLLELSNQIIHHRRGRRGNFSEKLPPELGTYIVSLDGSRDLKTFLKASMEVVTLFAPGDPPSPSHFPELSFEVIFPWRGRITQLPGDEIKGKQNFPTGKANTFTYVGLLIEPMGKPAVIAREKTPTPLHPSSVA